MSVAISFKPKQVTKKLLKVLPERSQEVLTGRFGLGKETQKETLESIGKKYGITRERVRQIENHALGLIRDNDVYLDSETVFTELAGVVNDLGGVIAEKELLSEVSKNESIQNHVHFLLVVGNSFEYAKEDFRLAVAFVAEQFAQWFEWVLYPFSVVMLANNLSARMSMLRKPETNVFEWLQIYACDNH